MRFNLIGQQGRDIIKRLLILMAKQPIPGKTKTRLYPALSPVQAADLYACFLQDKFATMRQVPNVTCAIAYTPAAAESYFAELAPDFRLYLQHGVNLAERLRNVVQQAFDEGYQQVMPIDGDSITLPAIYLAQGFEMLSTSDVDVVLGPSDDGGYYGIGLKAPHPCMFDVEMSTPTVSQDTIRQAMQNNLSLQLLPEWYDVDTPDDLARLKDELTQNPSIAPHTANYLKGM